MVRVLPFILLALGFVAYAVADARGLGQGEPVATLITPTVVVEQIASDKTY
ncbi:hypothetical protein SAMN04490248_101203 [Salinihabitans flavidus]|uniref:Uncharacterized protein n=1 Tax=Salinihabitans flavidus TaxID=569882 RepID=A0A1H8LLM5_9RHOB|nr:hypothetical protein [Salinihabitans flavidus]SEO06112.1 hypothetical protein SAMN04490248_101203 [Salinihabitans flavidus]